MVPGRDYDLGLYVTNLRKETKMPKTTVTLILFTLILALPWGVGAFEIGTGGVFTCTGHEFLSARASKEAGIEREYRKSIRMGARYVDLGGMTFANLYYLNKTIHENESAQHHHFCYRKAETKKGSVTDDDLRSLVKDTTAWIKKLTLDARNTPKDDRIVITDGGVVRPDPVKVNTRYFLLGAALHAIQDSFAHGYRSPTIPNPDQSAWAGKILKDIYGGPEGTKVSQKYRVIQKAVDYNGPVTSAATHNEVYVKNEGSPFWSDKIWNQGECTSVRDHLGNLVPHAFAAYLASLDYLRTFENNQPLNGFFERWFQVGNGGYPGLGNPEGKCSSKPCPHLDIPGESK